MKFIGNLTFLFICRLKKIYDLENKLNKSSVKLNRAHHIDVTTTRSCIEKLSFEDTVTGKLMMSSFFFLLSDLLQKHKILI